jgi:hypothetical protein
MVLVSIKTRVNAREEIRCHCPEMFWTRALDLEACSIMLATCLLVFVEIVLKVA